jgi:putative FmdB family regulatory protein
MPIYEYKCKACDHRLEKIQRMSDDPLKICPQCNQSELTKLVSASGFRLTGTGWYETDFKNKGASKSAESSSAGSSDS